MYIHYLRQKFDVEIPKSLSDLPVSALIFWEDSQIKAISGSGDVISTGTSFSSVFNAVRTYINNSGRIFIKSGTYVIDSPIIWQWSTATLVIEGEGSSTVLRIKNNEQEIAPIQIMYSPYARFVLRNFKFDGNSNAQNNNSLACIYLTYQHNVWIDNVIFENCFSYAIRAWSNVNLSQTLQNITISNCQFINVASRPIGIAGAIIENIRIVNNTFINTCSRFSVFANGRTGNVMFESSMTSSGYGCRNLVVANNYHSNIATNAGRLDYNIAAIQLYGCERAVIVGNTITGSGAQGMLIIAGGEHTIVGNVAENCAKAGFYIEGNYRTLLYGNIVRNNGGGIVLGAWSRGYGVTLTQRISDSRGVWTNSTLPNCNYFAGEIQQKLPLFLTWLTNARHDVVIEQCNVRQEGSNTYLDLTIDQGWGAPLPNVGTNATLVTGIKSWECVCSGNLIVNNKQGAILSGGSDRCVISNNLCAGNLQDTGYYGTLSTRHADDHGVFSLDPGFPPNEGTICGNNLVIVGLPIDIVWSGGARTGMTVTACTDNTVTASGGTGDALPPAGSNIRASVPYGYSEIVCYSKNTLIVDNLINTLPVDARRAYHFSNFLNSGNRGSYNIFARNVLLTRYEPKGYVWVYPPRFPFETKDRVYDNPGYATESRGVATIPSGQNSVTVTHNLAEAPTRVICTGSHAEVAASWVTNITATTFTINVANNVSGNRDVYWIAEVS